MGKLDTPENPGPIKGNEKSACQNDAVDAQQEEKVVPGSDPARALSKADVQMVICQMLDCLIKFAPDCGWGETVAIDRNLVGNTHSYRSGGIARLLDNSEIAAFPEKSVRSGGDGCGSLGAHRLRVRAVFISDLHLGTRGCQAERLLELLTSCDTDILYLVGDVVDGWRLKARWYWPSSHDAIVRCLLHKQQEGTRILYIPGNHDEFLRHSVGLHIGGIEVVRDAIHYGIDGRRYLVLHGDQFDRVVRRMRRLAALGIWVYAAAILANDAVINWRRRLGWSWLSYRAGRIRMFEQAAEEEARHQGMHGIICGHIHCPEMRDQFGVRYINAGDWIESCTAVVEHLDGVFEILRWPFDAPAHSADVVALHRPAATQPA